MIKKKLLPLLMVIILVFQSAAIAQAAGEMELSNGEIFALKDRADRETFYTLDVVSYDGETARIKAAAIEPITASIMIYDSLGFKQYRFENSATAYFEVAGQGEKELSIRKSNQDVAFTFSALVQIVPKGGEAESGTGHGAELPTLKLSYPRYDLATRMGILCGFAEGHGGSWVED